MNDSRILAGVIDTSRSPSIARRWLMAAEAAYRETAALARQTPLMPLDLGWRGLQLDATATDVVVVLHGLFATAGALRPLRRAIERAAGVVTASFTYEPGCDVRTLSRRLGALLSAVPGHVRIQLVGHSLGGIVARYYVQVDAGDPRVVQTISLGSPFHGTRVADFVPDFVARDVAQGARVLRVLEAHWQRGTSVPHLSVVASHDQLVSPTWSAAYPHGDVVIAQGRGHNALLFDKDVARVVTSTVEQRLSRRSLKQDSAAPSVLASGSANVPIAGDSDDTSPSLNTCGTCP